MVDDYSRYMWVVLLRSKDEAFEAFKKLKAATEMEHKLKVRALRTDRGGEFTSNEMFKARSSSVMVQMWRFAGKVLSSSRVSQENIAYSPECTTSHGFATTSSLSGNLTRMDARWIFRTE